MINWPWKKKERTMVPFGGQRGHQKLEDISGTRNIIEKLGAMELNHCFSVQTREGEKIFKLIEVR